jgi:penicillin-binding protein A
VDRRIRSLGVAFTALFALLFGQLAYVQVVAADRIENNPANATRQIIAEYEVQRGKIFSTDGVLLAESVRAGTAGRNRYERRYPLGPDVAHITGYYSRIFGRSGLEQSANSYLSGDAPELAVSTFADLVLGRPKQGGQVITTIDSQLQQTAMGLVENLPSGGAIAAVDVDTGEVLALASAPTFDPNELSGTNENVIRSAWARLNAAPGKPLLSKAKDEVYLPGSIFKIVTAAAALENGFGPESTWDNPHRLDLPQTTVDLENFGDEHCMGGAPKLTLEQAFTVSCNVVFGEVGLRLKADRLAEQARRFGFCATDPPVQVDCQEATIPFQLPFETGRFPVPSYFEERQGAVALSATGLDNDLADPLHMALIAASVGNRGIMMEPELIREIRDPQGQVVREFGPKEYGRPISSETAESLRRMMIQVTQTGTASSAFAGFQIPVAGKTGTATNGPDRNPNAWFVALAPAPEGASQARIAVAVIVLDGGSLGSEATGGRVAAPIAREIIATCAARPVCWSR